MATHFSVLAGRIPGTGEPGGLPSMGSHSRTRLKRLSSSSSRVYIKWRQHGSFEPINDTFAFEKKNIISVIALTN